MDNEYIGFLKEYECQLQQQLHYANEGGDKSKVTWLRGMLIGVGRCAEVYTELACTGASVPVAEVLPMGMEPVCDELGKPKL